MPAGSTKLAAWATTYFSASSPPKHAEQIDRSGNPFVNWSLIPPQLNDAYDFADPNDDAKDFGPTTTGTLIGYGVDKTSVLPALLKALVPDTLKFDTTLPDGYLQVPPNGRRLQDRTTDFLLTLYFNVQGPPGTQHPGNVTCPQVAQTAFSDCTVAKLPDPLTTAFPFVGPPLQQTP